MAQHLYDPLDPAFGDPRATRVERDRTFHICSDCRMCVKLCPSFRSLFEMIDDLGGSDHVSELTRRAAQARASTSATSASSATSSARTRPISSRSGGSTSRSSCCGR